MNQRFSMRWVAAAAVSWALVFATCTPAVAGESDYRRWEAGLSHWMDRLWPEARRLGISRATFDAVRRVRADYFLPGAAIRRQPDDFAVGKVEQAEFVKTPAEYLSEKTLESLITQGRTLAVKHAATLAAIEDRFGVPPAIVLAIWGRETEYGAEKLPYNAIKVLKTLASSGGRQTAFRNELLLAMKMLQEGHVSYDDMRSSSHGAMGQPQFLPSDFYSHAVDFDGDGRRDIWTSIPDVLASAAKQLSDKGWQRGKGWTYEVRVPETFDCTDADPQIKLTLGEWFDRGYSLAVDRELGENELDEPASLLLPAGTSGPAFLVTRNFAVLKTYNLADLYALFVGYLGHRIVDARPFETPWGKVVQLPSDDLENLQRRLTRHGFYTHKIDGIAGPRTRLAVGAYQKAIGLKPDCWPTRALLDDLQRRYANN